ncbi:MULTISPECIES: hypothetical protein [unclassified Microbacterium]|uniref:hypothetical protein n=1 Tax=Microbacterium TaxID=33882 RepID=UPI003BA2264E
MSWATDESGELTPTMQIHFVEIVFDRAEDMVRGALELEKALSMSLGTEPVFRALDGVLIAGGRIAAAIKPLRSAKKTAADVRAIRSAREEFMTQVFGDPALDVLQERAVRHRVEHFDEYLESALAAAEPGAGMVRLVGPRDAVRIMDSPDAIWVRHFDPDTGMYSVLDTEQVNVRELVRAGVLARDIARRWLIERNHPRAVRG